MSKFLDILKYMVLFMLFTNFHSFSQIGIQSKYIEVVMDSSSGRFYISTLTGDPDNPNDDKKKILFDKIPPTTYPSLIVDGEGFAVGIDNGYFENKPGIAKNKLTWTWRPKKFDKIKLIQVLEIVTNPFTMRDDMVRISYILVNEDNKERKVNVKLLLDTVLGEGDVEPFYIPFYGKIDNETVFYEANMPYIWYSFDSIKTPKVRTMGIVSGIGNVSTPSMLVFANWRKLDREKGYYTPEVGSSLGGGLLGGRDSAVCIYFKETIIKPQELILYSTMYGMYGDTLKRFDNFSASLTAPEEVSKFPFNTSLLIENTSGVDIRNLKVEIHLNTNYFYTTNSTTFFITNFKQGESITFCWEIFKKDNVTDGEYEIKAKISGLAISTNIEGEIFRKFKIVEHTNIQQIDTKELGIKQTNISTNFLQTNVLLVTNFFTNYITNTTYITNIYNYVPLDSIENVKNIIYKLNKELDYLITTYYISTDPEEREKIRDRINLIRQQIEVEKEKLKSLTELRR
ncbi:MAG: hypothetical protein N2712_05210 [Brevinematales bacterium]|nr:hypothetical protein [Brevinematales bacterium]